MSNILLIVTGSIAAYKAVGLAKNLSTRPDSSVKVILTESALKFIPEITFSSQGIKTYIDKDEWDNPAEVLHISLAKWADFIIVAPATFNTISKYYLGLCDNLALSAMHAFNGVVYLAPAMNTIMYENLKPTLEALPLAKNAVVLPTATKQLACGDNGEGRLLSSEEIALLTLRPLFPLKLSYTTTSNSDSFKGKDLSKETEIPLDPHVGSFFAIRKHDIHTGIDLYCNDGEKVYSMKEGVVESIEVFTGLKVGSPWWNETSYITVNSDIGGITLYGEIEVLSTLKVGSRVKKGQLLGRVKRVLIEDKGRPTSMLHLERYRNSKPFEGPMPSLPLTASFSEADSAGLVNPTMYIRNTTSRI